MPDPNQPTGDSTESSLAVLQVEALLGAAYTAVVRAQAQAALEAVAVIDRVGFTTGTDGSKTARVFEFAFHRHDLDSADIATGGPEGPLATTSQIQVSVPLLSLITPPNLIIDEAEIDLALEVVGHDQPTAPQESVGHPEKTDGAGPQDNDTAETSARPAVIHARVAADGGDATLKVKSRLKQVPAGGTARIHQLLDTAISDLGHLAPVNRAAHDRAEAARLLQRLTAWSVRFMQLPSTAAWAAMISEILQTITVNLELSGPENLAELGAYLDGNAQHLHELLPGNEQASEFTDATARLQAVLTRLTPAERSPEPGG